MQADPPPIVLPEYGERIVELTDEQASALKNLSDDRLTVTQVGKGRRWRIKAKSYVGTVVAPGVRVLINPKVPTANLFAMLEAGGKALLTKETSFDFDVSDELIPSFSTFYARHLEKALAAGVPREYAERAARLPSIRGRVDVIAQQRLTGISMPVECRFDDYLGDTRLARILRSAATALTLVPEVTFATRRDLKRLADQLPEAGPVTPADLRGKVAFTRLNEHCKPAERLARMVHDSTSLRYAAGRANAVTFLVNMNTVFAEFVAYRLRRHLAGRLEVRREWPTEFDTGGKVPKVRPDLVVRTPSGQVAYVADTKYKVTKVGFARIEDYYQLLAYTSVLGVDEGMLIYCRRDGDALPRQLDIPHVGKRLRTWVLDLDGTVADVERRLGELAEEIADRVTAAPAANSAFD